ncbi:MAG: hypothetical protein GY765_00365 [bacterium]|nr:hypothetical protein [bacterium]
MCFQEVPGSRNYQGFNFRLCQSRFPLAGFRGISVSRTVAVNIPIASGMQCKQCARQAQGKNQKLFVCSHVFLLDPHLREKGDRQEKYNLHVFGQYVARVFSPSGKRLSGF